MSGPFSSSVQPTEKERRLRYSTAHTLGRGIPVTWEFVYFEHDLHNDVYKLLKAVGLSTTLIVFPLSHKTKINDCSLVRIYTISLMAETVKWKSFISGSRPSSDPVDMNRWWAPTGIEQVHCTAFCVQCWYRFLSNFVCKFDTIWLDRARCLKIVDQTERHPSHGHGTGHCDQKDMGHCVDNSQTLLYYYTTAASIHWCIYYSISGSGKGLLCHWSFRTKDYHRY